MKFSVVIPCYNEALNIPLILKRFNEVIDNSDIEIVLVDNGSTDKSPVVLKELLPEYPFARSIRVEVNQGYGFGILSGLSVATGDYIGWTHADMQTDPYDVIKAFNIVADQTDKSVYVKGLRRGRSAFDNVFTIGMAAFETVFLGTSLWDINAQPNIFSKEFFQSWLNPPHDFSLDLYAFYMARIKDVKIIRFDVRFPERIHGTSSWNNGWTSKWKFIRRTMSFSLKLKKELKQWN